MDENKFPSKIPDIGEKIQLRITIHPTGVTYLSDSIVTEKGNVVYIEQYPSSITLHLSHPSPHSLRFDKNFPGKWQCSWLTGTDTPHDVEMEIM